MKTYEITDVHRVMDSVTSVTYSIPCSVCGVSLDVDLFPHIDPGPEIIKALQREWWLELVSNQYNQIGYACPGCIDAEAIWEEERDD